MFSVVSNFVIIVVDVVIDVAKWIFLVDYGEFAPEF